MKPIEISPKTIALFVLIPLGIYFLWIIKDIIFSLLIGFILMSSLRPGVNWLVSKKVPRSVAVLSVYFLFLFVFIYLISLVIPPIIFETVSLIRNLPMIVEDLNPSLKPYINVNDFSQYVPNVTNQVFSIVTGLFSNTLFVVSTLFFGLYFLIEENLIRKFLTRYFEEKKTHHAVNIFEKAEKRMSSWFWGEIVLMTVVGTLTYIGLNIIGVKYALPLAVLAGLFEVIPNIGPVISAIPAILIGFTQSYFVGFSAAALYFIVQQLENNLIVPIVMRRAVGINPIITLIALLVGGKVGGILGVLLAIPLLLFIETVVTELLPKKKAEETVPAIEASTATTKE